MEECEINGFGPFEKEITKKMEEYNSINDSKIGKIDQTISIPIHKITFMSNKNYLDMMRVVLLYLNECTTLSSEKSNELLQSLHLSVVLLPLLFTNDELNKNINMLIKLYDYDNEIISYYPSEAVVPIILRSFDKTTFISELLENKSLSKEQTCLLLKDKPRQCMSFIDKLPYVHCSTEFFNSLNESRFIEIFFKLYTAYCQFGELNRRSNTPIQTHLFDNMVCKLSIKNRIELFEHLPETPIENTELMIRRIFKKIGTEASEEQQQEMEQVLHCGPKEIINYFLETIIAYPNFITTIVKVVSKIDKWEISLMNSIVCKRLHELNNEIIENLERKKRFDTNDSEIAKTFSERCGNEIEKGRSVEMVLFSYLGGICEFEEDTFKWIKIIFEQNGFGEWVYHMLSEIIRLCERSKWVNNFVQENILIELIGVMEIERMKYEKDEWYDCWSKMERKLIKGLDLLSEKNEQIIFDDIKKYCRKMKPEVMWEIIRRLEKKGMKKGIKPIMEKQQGVDEYENNERIVVWEHFFSIDNDILGVEPTELEAIRKLQHECDQRKGMKEEELKKQFSIAISKLEKRERVNLEHFSAIRTQITKRKEFNVQHCIEAMRMRVDWFFKECIFKRVNISGSEALITAKIIEMMIEKNVMYVNGFLLIDKCIDNFFGIASIVSLREARFWGIFIGDLMSFMQSQVDTFDQTEEQRKINWHYSMEKLLTKENFLFLQNDWNTKINQVILCLLTQTNTYFTKIGLQLFVGSSRGIKTCSEITNTLDQLIKHPDSKIRKLTNAAFDSLK
ncbi:hypothetical protein CL6EHI_052850 [Entamoeba histolytica]|nr:hypothetical protein CL6EHI_052850 [Entamoeba histolytica]